VRPAMARLLQIIRAARGEEHLEMKQQSIDPDENDATEASEDSGGNNGASTEDAPWRP